MLISPEGPVAQWEGWADDWLARLQQREFDEVPAARASATFATHPLHGD